MESQLVKQRRVLACRPKEQNESWRKLLKARKLQTICIPLMLISPLESIESKQKIKNRVLSLDNYFCVIFVSQNAVNFGLDWIEDFWPQLPSGMTFYAIGAKTGAILAERCERTFPDAFVEIKFAPASMDSASLLAMSDLQNISGEKIMLCKGVGGRTMIQQALTSRGAQVEVCELYQRELPADAAALFAALELDKSIDIFPVFSGETLTNLHQALANNTYREITQIPLIVPGERVAALAKELGYENVHVAENATETCMMSTLLCLLNENVQ